MSAIRSAIACNLDPHLLLTALPLLESEKVQALEWSFDALYGHASLPEWFGELLTAFSQENRLIGHGVFFSLFSGRWTPEQQSWLDRLRSLSTTYRFDHITEHFGFMTGADFHQGAPLGIPFTAATLALGRDRLQRIQQACQCPVGLENLAFAYSPAEVKRHGDFLRQLVESVNGFIILDLHNLYCQAHNFDTDFRELLNSYPLERVREVHISGGSWNDTTAHPSGRVRRDTHDERVPEEVFGMLHYSLPLCPNLRYVVLEQLSSALATETQRQAYREDFLRMEGIVEAHNGAVNPKPANTFLPLQPVIPNPVPREDALLYAQQRELSTILEESADAAEARTRLANSSLAHSAWRIESWETPMLETAMAIARKWRRGFANQPWEPGK